MPLRFHRMMLMIYSMMIHNNLILSKVLMTLKKKWDLNLEMDLLRLLLMKSWMQEIHYTMIKKENFKHSLKEMLINQTIKFLRLIMDQLLLNLHILGTQLLQDLMIMRIWNNPSMLLKLLKLEWMKERKWTLKFLHKTF